MAYERSRRSQAARGRRAERAFLEALFQCAPLGLALLDPELRFVRVNPVLAEIDGLPAEDHVGRSLAEVVPGLAARLVPACQRVLATGQPLVDLEVTGATPAREGTWLAHLHPVSVGGEVLGVGAVVVEITRHKRAQRLLARAISVRDRLLASVSQDVSACLTSSLLAAHLVRAAGSAVDPRTRRRAAVIERGVARALEILRGLVELEGLESGQLTLHREPRDVRWLLNEALALARPAAEAREVRLELDVAASAPATCACDADQLARVFLNVLGNAVRFSPPGAVVTVRAEGDGAGGVRFEVVDDGPGMDPATLARAFERGFRGDPRHPGLGLGLTIARAVVEAHGGTIEARSAPGAGCRVAWTIPADG